MKGYRYGSYLANEALAAELADDIAVVNLLEVFAELALALELNAAGQARHWHVHTVHCTGSMACHIRRRYPW